MPPDIAARTFEPCFMIKPIGQGAGLDPNQMFGFARQLERHVALRSMPGHGAASPLFLPKLTIVSTKDAG